VRTLSIALFTEGPTDADFFLPLLTRVSVDLLSRQARHPSRVADPVWLRGRLSTDAFADRVEKDGRGFDVVVVHTDGGGDPQRALAERIEPWFASVADKLRAEGLVPLVPVRETEAWMLADSVSLAEVFGTKIDRRELGLPTHSRDVESITDPKRKLHDLNVTLRGPRRARKVGSRPLYAALGQTVSLSVLSNVPAFVRFREKFAGVLRRNRYIPEE
jgi:hypothetical protein